MLLDADWPEPGERRAQGHSPVSGMRERDREREGWGHGSNRTRHRPAGPGLLGFSGWRREVGPMEFLVTPSGLWLVGRGLVGKVGRQRERGENVLPKLSNSTPLGTA